MKLIPLSALLFVGAAHLTAQAAADTTRLPDRAVTAVKVNAVTGVAPVATTILYGDELRARGINQLSDALREAAGIATAAGGNYGSLTSLFLRGGESDYVKVLLDGIPLNQPGGSVDLANLTLDNIERIEIVRGPASVLHGADAMTGVIQLFTRKGTARPVSDVTTTRGTYGNSLYQINMGAKPANTYYSVSWNRFKSDGIYPFNSRYKNNEASFQIGKKGQDGEQITFTSRYGDATANYPTDYTGVPSDSNQFDRSKSLALGLEFSRPLGDYALLSIQGFGSRLNRAYTNRPDSPGDTLGYGFSGDRGAINWRRGGDARIDWLKTSGTRTSLGVAYQEETENQTSRTVSDFGGGASTELGDFDASRSTTSLYSQLYATPTPFVTWQLGARVDHNSAFGNVMTWRTGVSLMGRTGWRGWVAAGNAFKAPTFSELSAKSVYEVGNPDLNPERSLNFEAGIGRALPKARGTYTLTGYTQRFRDLIQYVGAAPGVSNYVNLGEARARGLELSIWYKLNPKWTTRVSASWLHSEVTDSGSASSVTFSQGSSLLRRPGLSGSVSVAYQVGGVTSSAVLSHVGKRDDADYRNYPAARTTLPAYQTVDLSVLLPLRRLSRQDSGIDLTLRGENVFDTSFEQVVGFAGRGRTLTVGIRLHQ